MDDPAVAPGLMPGPVRLLFQDDQRGTRVAALQRVGGRQTDYAAPDDGEIVKLGHAGMIRGTKVKSKVIDSGILRMSVYFTHDSENRDHEHY
jgi:hypothetical protein